MKKILLIILIVAMLGLFTACDFSKKYTPDPKVEQFLNTELDGKKALDKVATASYTVTEKQLKKDGTVLGSATYTVQVDKTDAKNISIQIENAYTGRYVQEGVTNEQVNYYKEGSNYFRKAITNFSSKVEAVDESFVVDYLTSLFYVNNDAYDEGGLYYGDFFLLYIYRYPTEYFYVDEQNNLCVFDGKMNIFNDETGNVHLHHIAKINEWGLLQSNYEKHESVKQDFIVECTLTASYTYID